jgi:hypothetical protein
MESRVSGGEVLEGLTYMMMKADNARDYETLSGAISIIKRYTDDKRGIQLPCAIGTVFYSIIGEKVSAYTVAGFRIEKDVSYIETEDGMLCRFDNFGKYFFWYSEEAAERFRQRWNRESKGA